MSSDASSSRLSEERLEILRLVENQTISADEATKLLEALDRSDNGARIEEQKVPFPPLPAFTDTVPLPRGPRARNVRIRITDVNAGIAKLDLVLPFGLLDSGLKMAKRIRPDRLLDSKEIRDAVEDGFVGHLLDLTDDGERVEILVELREGNTGGFKLKI